jgi:hypothetical protein
MDDEANTRQAELSLAGIPDRQVDEIATEALLDEEDEMELLMKSINSGTVPPDKVTEMETNSNSQLGCTESYCESKLYNYSKYGTRSRVGDGEQYIEADKPQMSSNYHQCKAAREAAMSYPTVTVSLGPEVGVSKQVTYTRISSLDCYGDTEILRTFRGSRITANGKVVNQNISTSYDPANLKCVVCPTPHYILARGEGESPPILVFSDQNFVSTLTGGNSCVAIARLEDASLSELVDISMEILDKHKVPPGTLLMYGSVSHLYNAGTTIYTVDWCNLVRKLEATIKESRILPLVPVIREDCPGTVHRQLIELATWYRVVYDKNTLGLAPTWQVLMKILSQTDEDGLDLGYSETYSVAMPSSLAPGAQLTSHKFSSNSSHTTTRGMVSEASYELLHSLITLLKCTFATSANPEDIFFGEPAEQESSLEKKTIVILGGSNIGKTVPFLEKSSHTVVDYSLPGWVPTPVNIKNLADQLASTDPDTVVVLDLLGNVVYRYAQLDGTLAMPFKSEGKYHFEGEIQVCNASSLKTIFNNLKPALEKRRGHLTFCPPLPRHLYTGCCDSGDHCTNVNCENHATKMMGQLNALRTSCIENLQGIGIKDFSVPDVIKLMMPACTGIPEYLAALKHMSAADGVHFSQEGYSCIANAIVTHISHTKCTVTEKMSAPFSFVPDNGKQTYYWRGFASPVGVCRPRNHNKAYKLTHPSRGGGKWGNGKQNSYNPYSGGKRWYK